MGVTLRMAANEIRIGVSVTGEDQAARDLKKVADAATKAGDAVEEMGEQSTEAGKASEKTGDKLTDTAKDAGHLKREIEKLTASYTALIEKFDETGDDSLKRDIRRERRRLRESQNYLKEITPDASAAGTGLLDFGKRMVESLRAAKGAAVPVLAGLAIVAAPAIGATVAGAVLGGVGVGGIVGGIALAADDPRVKAAGGELGQQLLREFQREAEPFVDPLLRGLDKVANAGWAAKLGPTFDKLAAKVDPLTDGLIGMVDQTIPGLEKVADAAGPTLDVLARKLPEIGIAVTDFFESVADNPRAAAIAVEELIDGLTGLIDFAGETVEVLADVYEGAYDLANVLGYIEPRMEGWKRATEKGTVALDGFGTAANEATEDINGLDAAIRKLLDEEFGLQQAQDDAADMFAILTEQIKAQREEHVKGAGALQGNTQAARDNRDVLTELTYKYADIIQKTAKAGQDTSKLRQQFIENAVAAGVARKEAEKYANALNFPRNIRTTLWIDARFSKALSSILGGVNSVLDGARAAGGPGYAGKRYLVGENGPEIVEFGENGYVHNASQTAAMMSGTSGGSAGAAGGVLQVEVTHRWDGPPGAAGDVGEVLARWIRSDVKVRGGGSITRAYDEN